MTIDAELQEQIRVTKAAAAALVGTPPGNERTLSVRDLLGELAKSTQLTTEQKAALDTVLKLQSFEGSSTVALPITVANDPAALVTTLTPVALVNPQASDSNYAQNASQVGKSVETLIAELTKMIEGKTGGLADGLRSVVAKATASEKLAEVTTLFGTTIDITDDQWEIRSKIGELVGLLCQQVKLEQILGTTTSAKKSAAHGWPADMAKADRKPSWGHDSQR